MEVELKCKICNKEFSSKAGLAGHIGAGHKMSMEAYVIKFYYNEQRPLCPVCFKETRFEGGKYTFKKYCKKHANVARQEWSKKHGFGGEVDAGWRRGLTKEEHEGIAKQAKKISGKNNPNYRNMPEHVVRSAAKARVEKMKLSKNEYDKRKKAFKNVELLTEYDFYKNKNKKNLKFLCKKCHTAFLSSLACVEQHAQPCPYCRDSSHTKETKEKIAKVFRLDEREFNKRIKRVEKYFTVLTPYRNYRRQKDQKLEMKCVACGNKSKRTLGQLNYGTRCWHCNPRSIPESEVRDFVISLSVKVESNTRSIIPPFELDIYCPERKFAIEYNGFYWHGEDKKTKNYHKQKTELCADKGIRLMHIFPDEWTFKRKIIKSMIKNRLYIFDRKIPARKCIVKEIESRIANDFFDKTHIDGGTRCKKAFGLFYQGELVGSISFRFPGQMKKYTNHIEIARFASALNTNIQGGFGKLFKYGKEWCIESGYNSVLTYADLRFGRGQVYEKLNFSCLGETVINYWYTDGNIRYNRFKFRTKKPLTEKQIAAEAGVWKVFGCGNKKFSFCIQQ